MRKYFIILLIGIVVGILVGCTHYRKEIPVAKNGVLDLRNWNFDRDGNVELKGEWEFYWTKHYFPDDFKRGNTTPPEYVPSGILWYSVPDKKYPMQGDATFRLKVLLKDTSNYLNLYFEVAPYSASQIYVNGELVGSNGKISDDTNDYNPSYRIDTKSFKADSLLDILILVSNHEHNRSGGIIFNITMGNTYNIAFLQKKSLIIRILIAGGIFVVMIYHFAFYLMWRSTISNLYFSLFSFFILLYFASLYILPYFLKDFHLIRIIRIFGWFMAVPIFTAFVKSIFPTKISKNVILLFSFIAALSFISYTLHIERTLYVYKAITIVAEIYVIIAAIRILKLKSIDSKIFFAGVLFVSLSGINDALTHFAVIRSIDLLPFGVFMFLLTQSYILAQRSAKTFEENKKLSKELVHTNKNLEKLVLERTKQIEQQNIRLAELNATKDRFFGIIAHNLRGPVGNWASSLGLLIDTYDRLDDATKLELITSLKSSTDKTFHLLENLLIWSRIQRNIITYNPRNMLIKELIDENVEILKPSADFKNISLNINIDENLKARCDAYMMNNVIRNLLSNAIKFTHENGQVNIKTRKHNGNIEIIIEDNGVGIDQNLKERLFKIEQNIMSKGTKGETGSGLGLIICKEFIDLHKGEINLESKPQKGTTVTVKLPVT